MAPPCLKHFYKASILSAYIPGHFSCQKQPSLQETILLNNLYKRIIDTIYCMITQISPLCYPCFTKKCTTIQAAIQSRVTGRSMTCFLLYRPFPPLQTVSIRCSFLCFIPPGSMIFSAGACPSGPHIGLHGAFGHSRAASARGPAAGAGAAVYCARSL